MKIWSFGLFFFVFSALACVSVRAQGWTPASLTTAAWYDAADTNTITESGGAVSQWRDKSGNAKHATQVTSSRQPSTGATIGSRNALSFSADSMDTHLNQLTTVSMYLVLDPAPLVGGGDLGPIGAATAWNGGGMFMALGSSGTTARYSIYYTTSLASASKFINGVAGANHSFDPAIFSHSGAGLSTQSLTYKIGIPATDYVHSYAGTIGEIIICPQVHDEATRQKVEGYLAWKWGLQGSLPANHPYKKFAPGTEGTVIVVR